MKPFWRLYLNAKSTHTKKKKSPKLIISWSNQICPWTSCFISSPPAGFKPSDVVYLAVSCAHNSGSVRVKNVILSLIIPRKPGLTQLWRASCCLLPIPLHLCPQNPSHPQEAAPSRCLASRSARFSLWSFVRKRLQRRGRWRPGIHTPWPHPTKARTWD